MGNLIGLTGLAGSGKDTAAQILIEHGWKREAFADRMRKAILALDPIVSCSAQTQGGYERGWRLAELVDSIGYDAAKRDFPEVRRLLQRFGTEAGRDIHGTNCWVDLVISPWTSIPPWDRDNMVITDCRFENEAKAIKDAGGHVIQIVRPDVTSLTGLAGGHASEAGFPEYYLDARILNEGTVSELHAAVLSLAKYYAEGPS